MLCRQGVLRAALSAHNTLLRAATCRVYRSLPTPNGARCLGIVKRSFTVNSDAGTTAITDAETDEAVPEPEIPRVRVAIELSYGEHMRDWERKSMGKQLVHIYGFNRRVAKPLSLYATGFAKDTASSEVLPAEVSRWSEHLQLVEKTAEVTWPMRDLVFLTPDARDPLLELKLDRVYVVHGLVDRSVIKNLTLHRGLRNRIQCLRLPLREFSPVPNMHPILTPLATVNILAEVHSGASWSEAIERHMVKRRMKHQLPPSKKISRVRETCWHPDSTQHV